VRRTWGPLVFDVIVPDSIAVQEALNGRKPVTAYSKRSLPAQAYRELCAAVIAREPQQVGSVTADVAS
jgi:MinD-like ATPase involved in chromosome partitioning or flagellar assembly